MISHHKYHILHFIIDKYLLSIYCYFYFYFLSNLFDDYNPKTLWRFRFSDFSKYSQYIDIKSYSNVGDISDGKHVMTPFDSEISVDHQPSMPIQIAFQHGFVKPSRPNWMSCAYKMAVRPDGLAL